MKILCPPVPYSSHIHHPPPHRALRCLPFSNSISLPSDSAAGRGDGGCAGVGFEVKLTYLLLEVCKGNFESSNSIMHVERKEGVQRKKGVCFSKLSPQKVRVPQPHWKDATAGDPKKALYPFLSRARVIFSYTRNSRRDRLTRLPNSLVGFGSSKLYQRRFETLDFLTSMTIARTIISKK